MAVSSSTVACRWSLPHAWLHRENLVVGEEYRPAVPHIRGPLCRLPLSQCYYGRAIFRLCSAKPSLVIRFLVCLEVPLYRMHNATNNIERYQQHGSLHHGYRLLSSFA